MREPEKKPAPRAAMAGTRAAAALCAVLALCLCAACTNAAGAAATKGSHFALVIGINAYKNVNALHNCVNDAVGMKAALETGGWTVASCLVDAGATRAAIKSAVAGLAEQSGFGTESTVLVFYSGHGMLDSNSSAAYIVPVDFSAGIPAISAGELKGWLGALPCRNRLLILDSCYSGGFVDSGGCADTSPQYSASAYGQDRTMLAVANRKLAALLAESAGGRTDPSIMTMSASGSEEFSWDVSELNHGVFTCYLLEAAAKGDSNGDGYVTMSEAFAYAKPLMKSWSQSVVAQSGGDIQYYMLPHISGGTGEIVLFNNN